MGQPSRRLFTETFEKGGKNCWGVKNLDGRLTRSGWPRGMDTGCRGTSRDLATFRLAKLGTTVFHQRETELRTPGITNHHGYDASSRFSFQRIFVPGIYRFSRRVRFPILFRQESSSVPEKWIVTRLSRGPRG